MRILILILLLFLCFHLSGQILHEDEIEKGLISGFHSIGEGASARDWNTDEVFKHSYVYLEPYVGYFFNRNFGLGPVAGYHRFRSTWSEDYDLFEIGGFARYYIPVGLNPDWPVTVLFLVEGSIRAVNYGQTSSVDVERSSGLDYTKFTFTPIGAEIKIWKGLYGELSTEWVVHSAGYDRFHYRIGLGYHIGDARKNQKD